MMSERGFAKTALSIMFPDFDTLFLARPEGVKKEIERKATP